MAGSHQIQGERHLRHALVGIPQRGLRARQLRQRRLVCRTLRVKLLLLRLTALSQAAQLCFDPHKTRTQLLHLGRLLPSRLRRLIFCRESTHARLVEQGPGLQGLGNVSLALLCQAAPNEIPLLLVAASQILELGLLPGEISPGRARQ